MIMNKSYGRIQFNKPKISQYGTGGKYHKKNRGILFYKKTLKQMAVCILIVLLAILIKSINTPFTNKTGEIINTYLQQEMNFRDAAKQTIKYVKEIPKLPDNAITVFNNFTSGKESSIEYIAPIKGQIISEYGESVDPILETKTFQRGLDISVMEGQNIVAASDGEVVEVGEGENLGKYIKIKHEENSFSLYGNCTEIPVIKGQRVKRGEKIARINPTENGDNFLHFELWIDGHVINPREYIDFDKGML